MSEIEKENFPSLLHELRSIHTDTKKNHISTPYGDHIAYFRYNVEYITNILLVAAKLGNRTVYVHYLCLKQSSWSREANAIVEHFRSLGFSAIYTNSYIDIAWS
jgi:hypothetical protein